MPVIKQRIPWTQQPQVASGIDWGNPLTKGLVALVGINGGKPFEYVSKTLLAPTGSPSIVPTAKGLGARATASTDVYSATIPTIPVTGLSDISWFAFAKVDNNAAPRKRAIRFANNNSSIAVLDFSDGSQTLIIPSVQSTTAFPSENTNTDVYSADVPYFIVGQYNLASGNVDGYVNGSRFPAFFDSVGTGTGLKADINQVYLANNGSAAPINGAVWLGGLYNRAISPSEIKSLSGNPWQIFAP